MMSKNDKKPIGTIGKIKDLEFSYVLNIDPELEIWRAFAASWFAKQNRGRAAKRNAIDKLLCNFITQLGLNKAPEQFFLRRTPLPSWQDCLKGMSLKNSVKNNNHVSDFLDWTLNNHLSITDDFGNRVVPAEFHNPVPRQRVTGMRPTETVRTPLPYRYIKELRDILCRGSHFGDWVWTHNAFPVADWFEVAPEFIDKKDPDCVWRKRVTGAYNRNYIAEKTAYRLGSREVFEIWSPVRAMIIFLKLELPLRTFQVRMLDSGEADTWIYKKGSWQLNDELLTEGTVKQPVEKGVFRRINNPETGKIMTGLYINTNKTADILRSEQEKGYIIPWEHEKALYWLEKLRNWQKRYNPIETPVPWTELDFKHLGEIKLKQDLKEKGSNCFLFRNAASRNKQDRDKPPCTNSQDRLWYAILAELERRCVSRSETLDDGTPLQFVKEKSYATTHFPPHTLRVSLITAYALEGGVPMPVLSKLIAGHARIIMTLYYVKAGVAHVTEVMNEAEKRIIETDQQSFRRFLANATYDQIKSQAAFNNPDAFTALSQQGSLAAMVVEDKGICPVGYSGCDCGGEPLNDAVADPMQKHYAPAPGYPHEKNCVRCRFFISGPAFLPGLQAHFNSISYQLSECSSRYTNLEEKVSKLEDFRQECDEKDSPFTKAAELNKQYRLYEQEAQKADKLANDLNATLKLIDRCMNLLDQPTENDNPSVKLVPTGQISDIKWALTESESDLHQLEVICENAEVFLETDASKAVLRRSQILDAMLMMNGRPPVFLKLTEDQQLRVGNELMALIKARTGSLKGAVELVEGGAKLQDLGLLNDTMSLLQSNDVQSFPASDLLEVFSNYKTKDPIPAIPETTGGA